VVEALISLGFGGPRCAAVTPKASYSKMSFLYHRTTLCGRKSTGILSNDSILAEVAIDLVFAEAAPVRTFTGLCVDRPPCEAPAAVNHGGPRRKQKPRRTGVYNRLRTPRCYGCSYRTAGAFGPGVGANTLLNVEPMTGIEPAYSAWEVDSGCLRPSRRPCRVRRLAEKHPCESKAVQVCRNDL